MGGRSVGGEDGGWGSGAVGDDGQVEREVVRVRQGEAMTIGASRENRRRVGVLGIFG